MKDLLIGIILILLIWVAVASGYVNVTISLGKSMEPALRQGDVFVTTNLIRPQLGDVVRFRTEDGVMLLHRVIRDHGKYIVTQGDSNSKPDKAILADGVQVEILKTSLFRRMFGE